MNKCIDCDKKISWGSKRCEKCYGLSRRGTKRPKHSKKMMGSRNPMYGTHRIGLNKGNKRPDLAEYNRTHSQKGRDNGMYGRHHTKVAKQKIGRNTSKTFKKLWQNKEYVSKLMKARLKAFNLRPNKQEKKLTQLLNKILPKEYKYVGNWKFVLERFNPDFVNINGQKKIIELYGDYWHNLPNYKKRDKLRIKVYKKYGYRTLIIWGHELKNLDKVTAKILIFNRR